MQFIITFLTLPLVIALTFSLATTKGIFNSVFQITISSLPTSTFLLLSHKR